jgi:ABC-type multidrug transport system fused ATPase/permease subunit
MRIVQAFNRQSANERHFREVNDHYREANHVTVVTNGLYFPFVDFLSTAATAIVLGYGGYRYFENDLTIGTLLAFMLYLSNFFDPCSSSPSSTTRSSPRSQPWTRSPRCSTRSRKSWTHRMPTTSQ